MKTREDLLKYIGQLKKEAHYWEIQAKSQTTVCKFCSSVVGPEACQETISRLEAQLALWKGTAP